MHNIVMHPSNTFGVPSDKPFKWKGAHDTTWYECSIGDFYWNYFCINTVVVTDLTPRYLELTGKLMAVQLDVNDLYIRPSSLVCFMAISKLKATLCHTSRALPRPLQG